MARHSIRRVPNEVDQARSRSGRRDDGSDRVRRDALSQESTAYGGLAKAGPSLFKPCRSYSSAPRPAVDSPSGTAGVRRAGWLEATRIVRSPAVSPPPPSARTASAGSSSTPRPTSTPSLPVSPVRPPRGCATRRWKASSSPTPSWTTRWVWCSCAKRRYLQVAATPAVTEILEHDSALLRVTRAFAEVRRAAPGGGPALHAELP